MEVKDVHILLVSVVVAVLKGFDEARGVDIGTIFYTW